MIMATQVCLVCEKPFETRASRLKEGRGKLCSKKCRYLWQKRVVGGEKSSLWRGGFHVKDGYKFIRAREHPHANATGYVREHRLVMEKKLGRFLKPTEVV